MAAIEEQISELSAALLESDELDEVMSGRPARVLDGLGRWHVRWLGPMVLPFQVVGLVWRVFRGRPPVPNEVPARLYRDLTGKDPAVARAEMGRLKLQLLPVRHPQFWTDEDVSVRYPQFSDAGLAAAADALVRYYLADRATDDRLLQDVVEAWARYEDVEDHERRSFLDGDRRGARRGRQEIDDQALREAYLGAWHSWLANRRGSGGG